MPICLGIDIGSASVKVAVVRSTYRRLALARVASAEVGSSGGVAAAVRAAAAQALAGEPEPVDAVAVAIDGSRAAIHRLTLPQSAQRQLAEVLGFELEAQVPFDFSGAVFDWRLLERGPGQEDLTIVAAVAKIEDVRACIDVVKEAIGQEPERVAVGAFVLGALVPFVPALAEGETAAIVDLGAKTSEVLVLERGEAVFARTVSAGTEGLPA
ncbi:MAG TPA: pilus assembly protein PilM, partial [Polyangiaceae bacterium]|nr:pilus assembly protein PilM [Polyangiaceae bacterium]